MIDEHPALTASRALLHDLQDDKVPWIKDASPSPDDHDTIRVVIAHYSWVDESKLPKEWNGHPVVYRYESFRELHQGFLE